MANKEVEEVPIEEVEVEEEGENSVEVTPEGKRKKFAQCPRIDGFDLFMYFYQNIIENVPVCNPWNKNMEKLIFLEVFVDVDLLKALINSNN